MGTTDAGHGDGAGDAASSGGKVGASGGNSGSDGGRSEAAGGRSAWDGGKSASNGGSSSSGGTANAGGSSGDGGASNSGDLPEVGSCSIFTTDDAWNTDVSGEPADPTWTAKLRNLVGDRNIHPDFGGPYGIPINVVASNQPNAPIEFDWYPEESDPGPYPFPGPDDVLIEGSSPRACDGDCHVLVVQEGTCALYEGYACEYRSDGWHCGNGAKWDLTRRSEGQRPDGWTSADAAGLPIMPGVVRYAEVAAGAVRHAIRFTVHCTRPNYVAPATHYAVPRDCDPNDPDSPPMGLRVRLKADYDLSSMPTDARVVLTAMQRYGMILADNGSDFYFQGDVSDGWSDEVLDALKSVPSSAFEALEPSALAP